MLTVLPDCYSSGSVSVSLFCRSWNSSSSDLPKNTMPLVPYSPSVAKSNCTLTCEKTGPTFNLIYYLHKWFPHDFMVSVNSFKSYSLQQDVYIYSKIDTGYAVGCSSLLLTSPYHSVSSTSQSDPFRRWCRP